MQINITNLTTANLVLDLNFGDRRRRIRRELAAQESFDIGDLATLDELNREPTIRRLVAAGNLRVQAARESGDLPGANDFLFLAGQPYDETVIEVSFAAAATGAADDVTVVSSLPFSAELVGAELISTEPGLAGATGVLRSATGGAGSALSSLLPANRSVATTGVVVATNVATATVALNHEVLPGALLYTSDVTTNVAQANPVAVTSVTATTVVYPLTTGDGALADGAGFLHLTTRSESQLLTVPSLARGSAVYLRRSDRDFAGIVRLRLRRTT